MNTPPSSPENPTVPQQGAHGGIEISGGQVSAAHDIVAGDVNVAGDSINAQNVTIERGYSARDVQRIALIVGGLVFITAACFFIFGAVSAAALVAVVNRPLSGGSSQQAAQQMQAKLQVIQSLSSGTSFSNAVFTEDEVSSYFRFILGPRLGIGDGRARLMEEPGQIALAGDLDSAGGLPFIAQLNLQTGDTPVRVTGTWVKILPTPDGWAFGWIPVTPIAQRLDSQISSLLFGQVVLTRIEQRGSNSNVTSPRNALAIWGTVK